jgi:glutathionylspermidine synthase
MMQRRKIAPRENWPQIVESQGLLWHGGREGGKAAPYWNESAFFEFTAKEVDELEAATNELDRMCIAAGQEVIDQQLYSKFGIPERAIPLIEKSWNAEPPSLYGRFDLAYDGRNPPKLLEYNADTPTSLLEAAVVQWYWLQDEFPNRDQFNSIHERLIALWNEFRPYLSGNHIHFTSTDDVEDGYTVAYLQDTAQQAGYTTSAFDIRELGWDHGRKLFVDPEERPLNSVFKLYPWEWLVNEGGGQYLGDSDHTTWIEPPWKMMLSNKAILAVLWEKFPGHPNLLETYIDDPGPLRMSDYVSKPKWGREGCNVRVCAVGRSEETGGDYGEEGYVYQRFVDLPELDGRRAVIGSWMIGHEEGAAGIGVREGSSLILGNLSEFVPHLFS